MKAQRAAANAELQPKLDAVVPAREAAVAAEAARVAAAGAAREAARELEPVSVFVSRRTQRLYVRRAFQPVLESPVTILDSDRPIGTHVFTALERTGDDAGMRWSVVSLHDGSRPAVESAGRGRAGQDVRPVSTGADGAKAALERIVIPQDALDRIAGMVSPRSSLIVSDEGLSSETGNGTDFVVSAERRAAGEPRDPAAPPGDRGALRIPARSPAMVALALGGPVLHLVTRRLVSQRLGAAVACTAPEHFPAKWIPVRRRRCDQCKESGAHSDSFQSECAPGMGRGYRTGIPRGTHISAARFMAISSPVSTLGAETRLACVLASHAVSSARRREPRKAATAVSARTDRVIGLPQGSSAGKSDELEHLPAKA